MANEKFITSDIFLASFLASHNLPVKLQAKELSSSKVIFVFDKVDQIYRLIAEFSGNGPAPILDYIEHYKKLRSKMYSLHGDKVAS